MHLGVPSSFSGLPVDSTSEVYHALAELDKPSFEHSKDVPPVLHANLGWIRLTHVGHFLRDVGLNMSTLWARDLDIFPKAFETFLARSKDARLHLHVDVNGYCHDHIMRNLSKLVPRAALVSSVLYGRSDQTAIETKVASRLIEDLCKEELPNAREIQLGVNLRDLQVPKTVIRAPNLKRLDLYGMFLAFTAPYLQNLLLGRCCVPDIVTLVNLLRTVPQLERFELTGCTLGSANEPLEPVFMPKLACFALGGQPPVIRALARYILFAPLDASSHTWDKPPRIQIDTAADEDEIHDSFACLSSRLPPLVAAPAALTFPMEMSPTIGMTSFIRVLLSDPWDCLADRVPPRHMAFESYPDSDWGDSNRSVAVFLAGLAKLFASSVHTIYVLGGISTSLDMFRPTRYIPPSNCESFCTPLRLFRSVTELHLGPAAGGLPALMHGGDISNEILFPALQTIYLNVSLVTGYPASHDELFYDFGTKVQHIEGTWWAEFVTMLAGRAAQGYGVHRLVLQGRLCHFAVQIDGEDGEDQTTTLETLSLERARKLVKVLVDERDDCGASVMDSNSSVT
ncbi:hypothetical protein PENSPDRAFT_751394 [Peniophora sp. CONT]|nr:hypothetical protein PENSPDRAFT_751394 [Peniophora sp. CONT]